MSTASPSPYDGPQGHLKIHLTTSPATCSIDTPAPTRNTSASYGGAVGGVIKYEPSGADDNEEIEQLGFGVDVDGGVRTAAGVGINIGRSDMLSRTTLGQRTGTKDNDGSGVVARENISVEGGYVGAGDDAEGVSKINDDNGDDDEQPCDLRLNTAMFMALQQAAIAAAVEHASPSASNAAAAAAAAAASAIMPSGSSVSSGMQSNQTSSLLSTTAPTAPHQHLIGFAQPQVSALPQGSVTPSKRTSSFSCSSSSGNASVLPHSLIGVGAGGSTIISGGVSGSASSTGAVASTSIAASQLGTGSPASWGGAYTCERCGNSYARPHSLNRHVRFECGVEPKFECPICHKKSKHKHNLVLHMRTHQHR